MGFTPVMKQEEKIITSSASLLIALLILYFLYLSPPSSLPIPSTVEITKGASLTKAVELLKSYGYVRSSGWLKLFVAVFGGSHKVIAGDYYFGEKENVIEIAWRITHGKYDLTQIKTTIPEGLTNIQISQILIDKFSLFNEKDFLLKAEQGKMFPDTYFLMANVSAQEVVERLKSNYELKIKRIEKDIASTAHKFDEILIMASILEKEDRAEQPRRMIADILWRRLKLKMPLQVDSAPLTYEGVGLPEKPISNPGLETILDAIYPTKNNFLYYLHDNKGNIYYAKTFEEHQRNRELYFRK